MKFICVLIVSLTLFSYAHLTSLNSKVSEGVEMQKPTKLFDKDKAHTCLHYKIKEVSEKNPKLKKLYRYKFLVCRGKRVPKTELAKKARKLVLKKIKVQIKLRRKSLQRLIGIIKRKLSKDKKSKFLTLKFVIAKTLYNTARLRKRLARKAHPLKKRVVINKQIKRNSLKRLRAKSVIHPKQKAALLRKIRKLRRSLNSFHRRLKNPIKRIRSWLKKRRIVTSKRIRRVKKKKSTNEKKIRIISYLKGIKSEINKAVRAINNLAKSGRRFGRGRGLRRFIKNIRKRSRKIQRKLSKPRRRIYIRIRVTAFLRGKSNVLRRIIRVLLRRLRKNRIHRRSIRNAKLRRTRTINKLVAKLRRHQHKAHLSRKNPFSNPLLKQRKSTNVAALRKKKTLTKLIKKAGKLESRFKHKGVAPIKRIDNILKRLERYRAHIINYWNNVSRRAIFIKRIALYRINRRIHYLHRLERNIIAKNRRHLHRKLIQQKRRNNRRAAPISPPSKAPKTQKSHVVNSAQPSPPNGKIQIKPRIKKFATHSRKSPPRKASRRYVRNNNLRHVPRSRRPLKFRKVFGKRFRKQIHRVVRRAKVNAPNLSLSKTIKLKDLKNLLEAYIRRIEKLHKSKNTNSLHPSAYCAKLQDKYVKLEKKGRPALAKIYHQLYSLCKRRRSLEMLRQV